MSVLRVDSGAKTLTTPDGVVIPCNIGRAGACAAEAKREGDGMTPRGIWPIRMAMFRPGRATPSPAMKLPWRWVRPGDGWSDGIDDPEYNRPVRHPHGHSAEYLERVDGLYDIIVVLGHNDAPAVAGMGSAIFLHCSNGEKPTEGCVAIKKAELALLLDRLAPGDAIEIV